MARDPNSFAPDDPPVSLPRKLAVELLERNEMFLDIVEIRSGKTDDWGRRIRETLTSILEA